MGFGVGGIFCEFRFCASWYNMVSGCCYFVDLSFADWEYFGRNCDKCGDFGAGGWGLLGEGSFPGALGLVYVCGFAL